MDNNQNNTNQEFHNSLSNSEPDTNPEIQNSVSNSEPETNPGIQNTVSNNEPETNPEIQNSATNSELDTNQEFQKNVSNIEPKINQEFSNPVINNQSDTNQVSQNTVTNKQPNSNNKFLIIVAILIIAIAGASYFTFLRKDVTLEPETHLGNKDDNSKKNSKISYKGYNFDFPAELSAKLNDTFIAIKNYTKNYKGVFQIQDYYCNNLLTEKASIESDIVDYTKATLLSSKIYTIDNREWLIAEVKDSNNMYWYEAITKLTDSQIVLTMFRAQSLDPNPTYKQLTSIIENREFEDRNSNHIEYIEPKDSIHIEGDIDSVFE